MSKIFIIHGSYGSPDENWYFWLRDELEKLGHKVFIPKFPTPMDQHLENWYRVLGPYQRHFTEDTIVVGHSLGVAFLLTVIERLHIRIKAAFFISGFIELLGNPDFDIINESFFDKEFDWDLIKLNCEKFTVIHSDNDPYVSISNAINLADKLSTEPIIIMDAGHFNEKSGYTTFDLLLEHIKREL